MPQQPVRPARDDCSCPKCIGPLRFESDPPGPIGTCRDCNGLWVDSRYLFEFPDEYAIGSAIRNVVAAFDSDRSTETELLCPLCSKRQLRLQRMGGIELEWCPGCSGIFFDPGEIERWIDASPRKQASRFPSTPRTTTSSTSAAWGIATAGEVLEFVAEMLLAAFD